MRSMSLSVVLLGSVLSPQGFSVDSGTPPPGGEGYRWRYLVLSGTTDMAPPFGAVDLVFGPEEKVGRKPFQWRQLEVHRDAARNGPPACVVRALTSPGPLSKKRRPLQFARYQLHIPETGETLEYREVNTGKP